MRVLISTIGSRGEAQPVLALAVALRALGHDAVVCAPPDFAGYGRSLGVDYRPVGPWLRGTATGPSTRPPTAEQRRRLIEGTVADQFAAVRAAATGIDAVVGGGALAIAAGSIAEAAGVPYVYAAFAPITLPSPHHAPPVFGMLGPRPGGTPTDLWEQDRQRWNTLWRAPLNTQRAALGLSPVDDVRDHLFTARPWLAADPTLAPWPGGGDLTVEQTGAWILPDTRPLDPALTAFLDAGDPPIHLGLGSMRAPDGLADAVIAAARARGERVVLAGGWAGLTAPEAPDVHPIGEVNQQALFPRCAAVVHHGGAGTTTAAARAGVPQVITPRMFDQFYFADRATALGIATTTTATTGSPAALAAARSHETVTSAAELAPSIALDGATTAARLLVATVAGLRPA